MSNYLELPAREIIKVRNDLDSYGFSYLLAKRMKLTHPPRSFGSWVHGWTFWESKSALELGYDSSAPRDMPIVVASVNDKATLEAEGFETVLVGCLPFVYTSPSQMQRKPDSLIAFIPHGFDYLHYSHAYDDFLDYVYSIKGDFQTTYICVYAHDATDRELMNKIRKRDLQYVIGAQPEDANSLMRMRWIFDQFEYVLSAQMGSHLLYSAYCGCKTSFSGPFYTFDAEPWKRYLRVTTLSEELQRVFSVSDEAPNRERYPWLFVKHPRKAVAMQSWAQREIGAFSMLDNETIVSTLGWSALGQATGVMRALKRRLTGIKR